MEQMLCHRSERTLRLFLLRVDAVRMIRSEIAIEILPNEHGAADGDAGDDTFPTNVFGHIHHLSYQCIGNAQSL